MDDLEQLTYDVKRLRLQPGDAIVVKVNRMISKADAERVRHLVTEVLGNDLLYPVVVIDDGADLLVLDHVTAAGMSVEKSTD